MTQQDGTEFTAFPQSPPPDAVHDIPRHSDDTVILKNAGDHLAEAWHARTYAEQTAAFDAAAKLYAAYDGPRPHGKIPGHFLPLLRRHVAGDTPDFHALYTTAAGTLEAVSPYVSPSLLFSALHARAGNQNGVAYPLGRHKVQLVHDDIRVQVHPAARWADKDDKDRSLIKIATAETAANAARPHLECTADTIGSVLADLIIRDARGDRLEPNELVALGEASQAISGNIDRRLMEHGPRLESLRRLIAQAPGCLQQALSVDAPFGSQRPEEYLFMPARELPPEYFALQLRNYELNYDPWRMLAQAWDWIDLASAQGEEAGREQCFAEAHELLVTVIRQGKELRETEPVLGRAYVALMYEPALRQQAAGRPIDQATARQIYLNLGQLLAAERREEARRGGGSNVLYRELLALALSARDTNTLAFPAPLGRLWNFITRPTPMTYSDYVPFEDGLVARKFSSTSRTAPRVDTPEMLPENLKAAIITSREPYIRSVKPEQRGALLDKVTQAVIDESAGKELSSDQRKLIDAVARSLYSRVVSHMQMLRSARQ